jgi:DNA-binding winged helix-turn-helix (wHTH) protein
LGGTTSDGRVFGFAPFRYEVRTQSLWKGSQRILLRAKSSAVLLFLLEHPDRFVSRGELLDALWGRTLVVGAVLKVSVREIRQALGDNVLAPKFIESNRSAGYRFVGRIKIQSDRNKLVEPERLSGPVDEVSRTSKKANASLVVDGRINSACEVVLKRSAVSLFRFLGDGQSANHTLRSFLQSAQRAIFRHDCRAAANYCKRALAILSSVPESARRNQLELRLILLVGCWLRQLESRSPRPLNRCSSAPKYCLLGSPQTCFSRN